MANSTQKITPNSSVSFPLTPSFVPKGIDSSKPVGELSTVELAQALAERLAIAPADWHRLKANRKARAAEQTAMALLARTAQLPRCSLHFVLLILRASPSGIRRAPISPLSGIVRTARRPHSTRLVRCLDGHQDGRSALGDEVAVLGEVACDDAAHIDVAARGAVVPRANHLIDGL